MMFFSFYENGIKNTIPSKTMEIEEFLKLLKQDDNLIKQIRTKKEKKDRDLIKQKLSYVTFGGTFSTRGNKNLIEGSGLACFDIDGVEKLEELRNKLKNDKYVFCLFVSPSGNGLKVLVKIPKVKDNNEYKSYWLSIAEHFDLTDNDEANKDIARACYLSYDEEPYLNQNSKIYTDKTEIIESEKSLPLFDNKRKIIVGGKSSGKSNELIDKIKSSITMPQILSSFGVDTSINPTICPFHVCSQRCLSFNSEVAHCFDDDCRGDDSWNIFSFVKKVKNFNSFEAVEWLADFAGLSQEFKKSKEDYFNKNLGEPRGWALSISINRMAERYDIKNCPQCNLPFKFTEKYGFYECETCRYRGGLKKFAELIAGVKS